MSECVIFSTSSLWLFDVPCCCRYDRHKLTLKEIHNVQYVACMNPTAGSFTINPRLLRHFSVFAVSFPGETHTPSHTHHTHRHTITHTPSHHHTHTPSHRHTHHHTVTRAAVLLLLLLQVRRLSRLSTPASSPSTPVRGDSPPPCRGALRRLSPPPSSYTTGCVYAGAVGRPSL